MTAATDLADFLTAVANHLRANPGLRPVNTPAHRILQLTYTELSATELTKWADSLTEATATALPWSRSKDYPRAASVSITGTTADGIELTVWVVVQEMKKPLGITKATSQHAPMPFDLAVLRDRAAAEQAEFDAKAVES